MNRALITRVLEFTSAPDERFVLVEADRVWIGERLDNTWSVRFGKRSSESRQHRMYTARSSEAASQALAKAVTEKRVTYKDAPQREAALALIRKRLGLVVAETGKSLAITAVDASAGPHPADLVSAIDFAKRHVVVTTIEELAAVITELRKGSKLVLAVYRATAQVHLAIGVTAT